jgi:hypothetical protein
MTSAAAWQSARRHRLVVNGAGVISSLVPLTMEANALYDVRVAMRNNGATTWVGGGVYALGSRNSDNNTLGE